jgi:outer membrane protein OmpA-like peptidoglycan-associated protein
MEEIKIEPRRNNYGFLWILGIIVFLTLAIWVFNTTDKDPSYADNSSYNNSGSGSSGGVTSSSVWKNIELDAPRIRRPELNIYSNDFSTRGNDRYTIYSLGENLLFDTNEATLNTKAQKNLKEIAASINKRYEKGLVRIYGYTDARSSDTHNKALSEERAMAVKNWLQTKGNIDESRISIHPMGESDPIASNKTAPGQHQNRRVEIVATNLNR